MQVSTSLLPKYWVNERRRRSKPASQTQSWISRTARQRSTGPVSPNCFTDRTARSNATQAITLDCVK
jgi:hypothetical protein